MGKTWLHRRLRWYPGSSVFGTVVKTRKALRVADVHAFEGHIACDVDSRSEIVLPG